jgi:hypothetical protein
MIFAIVFLIGSCCSLLVLVADEGESSSSLKSIESTIVVSKSILTDQMCRREYSPEKPLRSRRFTEGIIPNLLAIFDTKLSKVTVIKWSQSLILPCISNAPALLCILRVWLVTAKACVASRRRRNRKRPGMVEASTNGHAAFYH